MNFVDKMFLFYCLFIVGVGFIGLVIVLLFCWKFLKDVLNIIVWEKFWGVGGWMIINRNFSDLWCIVDFGV